MSYYPPIYGTIDREEPGFDLSELAAQTGMKLSRTDAAIQKAEQQIREVLDCKYSGIRVPVSVSPEEDVDLGFAKLRSHSLSLNLKDCNEAFVFAVTLGSGVDRALTRLAMLSQAEHYLADAVASVLAEDACRIASERLAQGIPVRPRFSPGFGDLELSFQPQLLEAVNAARYLGIGIGKTLLMSPMKSITAIMGICK